ncbi:S9 family peptidase [Duganella sp. LX20W]|uniref:S9 family peptidase n=1 Tax=Rugamonas brunnea TaxID=2758569 RepID=A0A7W2IDK4_9BURK|nr:alpha/beta fold hydrolase [Rugamonas brunnea]MBA5639072.1 S9 family peptidase [Rugamonas brunnea]
MRHHTLKLSALALGCTLLARAAVAAPPPLESFFENPAFTGARLSPSGKYLAARVALPGQHDRLAVVDLATLDARIAANFTDADIGQFVWVNDERLAFTATDRDLGPGDQRYAPGLYAVDRDGRHFRQLAERGNSFFKNGDSHQILPWNTYLLGQDGAQDSEFIYVLHPSVEGTAQLGNYELQRLNTITGRVKPVAAPEHNDAWLLDQHGEPRLTITTEQGKSTVHYLDPASGQWRAIHSFNPYTGEGLRFAPLAFAPDGKLYVRANGPRDDQAQLYLFDPATGKLGAQPLLRVTGYDFSGHVITDAHTLLGVRYDGEARDTKWLTPETQALQDAVDAKLPATVNLLSLPARPDAPWVLVEAYSDRQPHTYLLYNRDSHTLHMVGETFAHITPADMGSQKLVHYQARDGLAIPALLTLPKDKQGKLPMVVLVHGGPWVRGNHWGFNPEAQFLASRGYAVLEPDYRGSTGYGYRHFKAGWKQWGLKMQDDIADGTRWAIAQGYADAGRICIAGASYGGYATLMGLVNDPDLYKCGVDWVGVTDINLMYDGNWRYASDMSDSYKQYGMPQLVGDQVKDAAQLTATSPLMQAARIKQPLLLAYGGADLRVPLYHGNKFYDAVKAGNQQVEWVEYPEEGHGWKLPKNRIDFWGRVEKFLDRNIGH